jgi:type 1 fimbriae regulatory protein FimB/type 1 fimbriae regulatory protein FimE
MTPYANRRARKYLHQVEVICLAEAARRTGRHGHRDSTLIWTMFRHGLRVSEAQSLTWGQLDLERRQIHVTRSKSGSPSIQMLHVSEIESLRQLQREGARAADLVFVSERGTPLSHATIYKLIVRAGRVAEIDVPVNPHMLRHACGHHLTNVRKADTRRVQDYLGHRDIRHTVLYTELDGNKFDGLWGDEDDTN